jgi:putative FmdB family regulatory protein
MGVNIMPIYEYRCQACGHDMEAIQKMSDPVLTECPVCGKPELKKLISAAGFQLKGSGWYETYFKGGKKKPTKDSGGSDGSKASAKPVAGCAAGGCGCASGSHKH